MIRPLAIREISAARGETARGFVTVGETAAGPLGFPVVIVNGREDGPTLCLTAGVHATEYAAIAAVMRILQEVEAAELRGSLIAVPVANVAMYSARSGFVSPIDGLNLNKIGAGRTDGSISEMLANALLDDVIAVADYHIDLHGGDLGEMLMPFAACALTGDPSLDRMGETLVRRYSPRLISLASPGTAIPPFPDGIVFAASRRGIVSIMAEAGGNGSMDEDDIRIHVDGVRNVMRSLAMVSGEPTSFGPHLAARDRHIVRATRAGLLSLRLSIGEDVRPGQQVGEVRNVFGDIVEYVEAPGAGVVGLLWTHKVVSTGDPIFRYWITEPA